MKQSDQCLHPSPFLLNPQQWDDEWFRGQKISGLNHSAMGGTICRLKLISTDEAVWSVSTPFAIPSEPTAVRWRVI